MYPSFSHHHIDGHKSTVLRTQNLVLCLFVIEKAYALKFWGRKGLWLNLEYFCSNQGLVLTKMSAHGELG